MMKIYKTIIRAFAAVTIALCTLLSLVSCNGGDGSTAGDKSRNESREDSSAKAEKGIKITPTAAKSLETEKYETADFSITIPKGWKVTSGGINIYHSIRVYDPEQPLNQMFVLLKADVLLHSLEGKSAWQKLYSMGDQQAALFAKAPALESPSTEGFYKIFPQYAAFVGEVDPTYSGYAFPRFDGFTVTERFASSSGLKAYSIGEELLRATFTEGGKAGEGLFAASVVDFGSYMISNGEMDGYLLKTVDGGYYMAYNIMAVTAVKDTFIEWESILTECMKTLEYSASFVNATNQASNEKVALAMQISQNFNQTMDAFMSSWENRNRSQDIISQKQSDATLGYERVYDTETNEVYKATNGFSDAYDGKRYLPVTDDNMYTQPVIGYIEKVG